jgi:hypothetical protein
MNFKHHLERAWRLTIDNLVPLILMTLVMVVVSLLSLGILAMVTLAGYTKSILLMIRTGREPKLGDVFSEMKLFLPLLGYSLAVFIITAIGFALLFIPGVILACAIAWASLYMLPLMVDKGMGVMEAVKESFRIVSSREDIMDHIVLLILLVGISAVGSSVFIGWLFTQPFAMILLLSAYEEKVAGGKATPPSPPAETID